MICRCLVVSTSVFALMLACPALMEFDGISFGIHDKRRGNGRIARIVESFQQDEQHRVYGISVDSPSYTMSNGLKVGNAEERGTQTLGKSFHLEKYAYKEYISYQDRGLTFEVHKKDRTVTEITITQSDPSGSIQSVKPFVDDETYRTLMSPEGSLAIVRRPSGISYSYTELLSYDDPVALVRTLEGKGTEQGSTGKSDVPVTREDPTPRVSTVQPAGIVPTKEAGDVQWKGSQIVSRVLPYPDLTSLFVRTPVAHAAVTGDDVSVAVLAGRGDAAGVCAMVRHSAPAAEVRSFAVAFADADPNSLYQRVRHAQCRVALIPDVHEWPVALVRELVRQLLEAGITVVAPSDLSEQEVTIELINALQARGMLTVGRVDRQSMVMRGWKEPLNARIRDIRTDVFSTVVGPGMEESPTNPAATGAGVAALVLEKWPSLSPVQVRDRIVRGARQVWQNTSVESGRSTRSDVDPVTTKFTPRSPEKIFRFRALDAAGALGVDTEVPWFLNMLNCPKAWEITKGRGAVVAVSDMGFHVKHPELAPRIKAVKNFGPRTTDDPGQNFHGTEMSRILLAVAPEAELVPLLCSADTFEAFTDNIANSFVFAAEKKFDAISSSMMDSFRNNADLLAAIRRAVDQGVVVSWFHYPQAHPGILRPAYTWSSRASEPCLGFSDRFLTNDPHDFHPVEVSAGRSGTAPQAAGLAALVRSVCPGLPPSQVQRLIFENSTPITSNLRIPDAYEIVLAARRLNNRRQNADCIYPIPGLDKAPVWCPRN